MAVVRWSKDVPLNDDDEVVVSAPAGGGLSEDLLQDILDRLVTIDASLNNIENGTAIGEYETVSASQTNQALGATGATGDYLSHVLIVPATTSPGAVSIKDGANSAITIFAGGSSSVAGLHSFSVPLGLVSTAGAWQITTGANVSVVACGNFT